MPTEVSIMQLIARGGDARSHAMKGIALARDNNSQAAYEEIDLAKASINEAHRIQTDLIQAEARGEKTEISLLMIHAQDHLMNAMTVLDLAIEFIKLYETRENV